MKSASLNKGRSAYQAMNEQSATIVSLFKCVALFCICAPISAFVVDTKKKKIDS